MVRWRSNSALTLLGSEDPLAISLIWEYSNKTHTASEERVQVISFKKN
jgi:hypothetical protein